MPYKVQQSGDNWEVVNSETNEVRATHEPPDAKEKAERQVKLLGQIEDDPEWDADNE